MADNINLNFLFAGDDVDKIFQLTVSKRELVSTPFPMIQTLYPRRITDPNRLALYKKNFTQDNRALASSLASFIRENRERQGEYMEPQKTISRYFPEQPNLTPYYEIDGETGPVDVIVYYTPPEKNK
jgi:hypothetical protein